MKKTMKILSLLLAVMMTVQMAPISAIGDVTDADTYESLAQDETNEAETSEPETSEPEAVEPETSEPEVVEPETSEPETSAPEAEEETEKTGTPLFIRAIQWRDNSEDSVLTTLTDGMTVYSNAIVIRLNLNIAPQDVDVKVNGAAVDYEVKDSYVTMHLELLNGTHRFDIAVTGEINTVKRSFELNVEGEETTYPTFSIEGTEGMVLGQSDSFTFTCDNLDKVASIEIRAELSTAFKLESFEFAPGISGACTWFRGKLTIVVEVTDEAAVTGDEVVTIRLRAPATSASTDDFSLKLEQAIITPKADDAEDGYHGAITIPEIQIPVSAAYTVTMLNEYNIAGMPHVLVVNHNDGTPAVGVSLYVMNGKKAVLLGTTDAEGQLSTDAFDAVGTYQVYAEDGEGQCSFLYTFYCMDPVGPEDGAPYGILYNGVPAYGMNFTWMSNLKATDASAVLLLATNPEMTDAVTYTGNSVIHYYLDSRAVNRVNNVGIEGLTPGVYYYCVGDGNVWSEVKAFTVKSSNTVNVAILGDMMNSSAENISLIANAMANSGVSYDLGVQTGDVMQNTLDHVALEQVINGFASFGDLDMIFAQGKNDAADSSENMYFKNYSGYVGYEIGNLYVGVIGYTEDEDALYDSLYAMHKDVDNSLSRWQILVIQQSPYSTDPEKADSLVAGMVPNFVESAGIDFVFSADEAVYARTNALKDGVEDVDNGVYYVVCGSFGEHSETPDGEGFAVVRSDYNAVYLSLTSGENEIILTVYNVLEDGTVEILDTVVRNTGYCADGEHKYVSSTSSTMLVCDVCSHRIDVSEYVGLVSIFGSVYYLEYGRFVRGWKHNDGKTYYIPDNSYSVVNGAVTINGHNYVFEDYVLVEGSWETEDGVTKLYWADQILTNTWHTQRGVTYYFLEDGSYAVGEVEIPAIAEDGETVYETYLFDENGALIGKKDSE